MKTNRPKKKSKKTKTKTKTNSVVPSIFEAKGPRCLFPVCFPDCDTLSLGLVAFPVCGSPWQASYSWVSFIILGLQCHPSFTSQFHVVASLGLQADATNLPPNVLLNYGGRSHTPFPSASFTTPKLAPCEWCSQVHVACWEWNLTLSLDYIYINFPSLFRFSLGLFGRQLSGIAGKSLAIRLPYTLLHYSFFLSAQTIAQH